MTRAWVGRAALGACALLAGCGVSPASQVRSKFSSAFTCDESYVKVVQDAAGYQATGCARQVHYRCEADKCQADSAAKSAPLNAPAAAAPPIELHLAFGGETSGKLSLVASPQVAETAELTLSGYFGTDCELGLMIDGQRVSVPAGKAKASLALPREVVRDLGAARQVGLRACGERWSLTLQELQELHAFVQRYEEELAWQDTPRDGSSGGRRPPAGGWLPWAPLAAFPAPVAGAEAPPSGAELFTKLAPSVLRVEGKREGGQAQGSAVAVTKSSVITNCHVVEGALKIIVKQGKNEWAAKLSASDPVKDRCQLEVAGAAFTPVVGVRPYVDLKVGEPLYSLGNPSGLDLSWGNGILSSLREDKGLRYVQTTAPISPGSSGGGLFDARGNLVGITTLAMVGKERLNQSLNFAIAAEMFWSP